jgi:hypothetical protein
MYIDTFEDETPVRGLHDLFQIEVENRRRIARAEQTASDEFPSPSSNYFVSLIFSLLIGLFRVMIAHRQSIRQIFRNVIIANVRLIIW